MAVVENPVRAEPRTLCFGHILLMVENLDNSVAFYTTKLGFTIRPAKPVADGRYFIAFAQGIALVSGREAGHRQVDHIAFEVDDVRPIRALIESGWVGTHSVPRGGSDG